MDSRQANGSLSVRRVPNICVGKSGSIQAVMSENLPLRARLGQNSAKAEHEYTEVKRSWNCVRGGFRTAWATCSAGKRLSCSCRSLLARWHFYRHWSGPSLTRIQQTASSGRRCRGQPGRWSRQSGNTGPLTSSLNIEPPEARGLNTVIRAGPGHVYVSAAAAQAFREATKRQRNAAAAIGRQANTVLNSADNELVLRIMTSLAPASNNATMITLLSGKPSLARCSASSWSFRG